ncbi:AzlD family protein [Desulfovibrio ferrophilus]|uniref:Branched-chain amino acid transport n=1 Tax=Desulfovibrio ferrophilus TaxID=241368 RepID=A0A2Z6B2V9_9BACT|nr:AzlD domain-containing protein [Desulfovibrio ferrophilus]BBD09778.1 branched-chain amino acid transport [Desulfovibrio ferrophilus]
MTDATPMLTIAAMAAVTYLTRAAGLFITNRIRITPRAEAFLSAIPGAVLISIIAPAAFTQGPAEALAALGTLAVAAKTRNLPLSMGVGIGLVWALRQVL